MCMNLDHFLPSVRMYAGYSKLGSTICSKLGLSVCLSACLSVPKFA